MSSSVLSAQDSSAVSTTVVEAVARERGVPVTEIDTPLNDVVDPDALDALFGSTMTGKERMTTGHVEFTFAGCDVVVEADGSVRATDCSVDEAPEEAI